MNKALAELLVGYCKRSIDANNKIKITKKLNESFYQIAGRRENTRKSIVNKVSGNILRKGTQSSSKNITKCKCRRKRINILYKTDVLSLKEANKSS